MTDITLNEAILLEFSFQSTPEAGSKINVSSLNRIMAIQEIERQLLQLSPQR
ncbi:hypothetical protein [Nostoc sp.]|uniref:hypothetical protein n=1 Tax=Nostoc sp. TaxID=1180 RepID=UPI002FF68B37